MSNPVDEYLEKYGQGRPPTTIQEGLMSSAVRAGALAGAVGLYEAAKKTYRAITKQRDFDAMMQANPDLKAEQRRDPTTFNRFYNSLRTMNPQFAAEPVVAGTYMRKMMTSPEGAGGILVESLQAGQKGGKGPGFQVTMGPEPSFQARL